MAFGFAFVDPEDTAFAPAYFREDVAVFAFRLSESEGAFAVLELVIENPRTGLLNPARKQWLWFSYSDGVTVTPLFFGRLSGVPQEIGTAEIRLRIEARPAGFEAAKQAVAAAVRLSGPYDPVWIRADLRDDPDTVLEFQAADWHIDRVTHAVTIVPIDAAPDGVIDIDEDHFPDGLAFRLTDTPLASLTVTGKVTWDQAGEGDLDITPQLIAAFHAAGSNPALSGFIESYTGGGLMADWPTEEKRIGGVWRYGPCAITREDGLSLPADYTQVVLTNADIADFPRWKMVPQLTVRYAVSRRRTETITFTIEAGVQALTAEPDPAAQQVIEISADDVAGPIDPDGALPIGTARRASYFRTGRGLSSLEALLAIGRARMLARARAVEVRTMVPFETAMGLTLRHGARIAHPDLPGGEATGKIKAITITLDGQGGMIDSEIVIGCMIGQGGTATAVAGTPDYVTAGYVSAGYQSETGAAILLPFSGDIAYGDYRSQPIDDDGFDLVGLSAETAVTDLFVINGPDVQARILAGYDEQEPWTFGDSRNTFEELEEAVQAVNAVYTQVDLTLIPVETRAFETDFTVTTGPLAIGKGIDLEAA